MSEAPRTTRQALIVGGYGALGTKIATQLAAAGNTVLRTSRTARPDDPQAVLSDANGRLPVDGLPCLDVVVWAHGINVNDSTNDVDADTLSDVLDVNLVLVAQTLAELRRAERIRDGARLVVLSSIWGVVARAGKLSYAVSKAGLGGLVRAASVDLAPRGILVNAVLPGVVDTPMTRNMLSVEQLDMIKTATPFGRLVEPADVASLVVYLCSPANTAVTGQSIAVDLGFSVGRSL
jgi:NAD(P)-dependent dehydrogenase (short-subunit alcohol dehydrogenase family)